MHPEVEAAREVLTEPLRIYQARADTASKTADSWRARFDSLANVRLGVILALVVVGIAYVAVPSERGRLTVLALLLFAGFIVLVVRHARIRRQEIWYRELSQVAIEAHHLTLRQWTQFEDPTPEPPTNHPYADDLDVFGHASLHVLLRTTGTRPGADMLTDWLLAPAPSEVVRQRQDAVRELTPAIDFRDELHAMGRIAGPVAPEELRLLLEWAESPAWLLPMRGLKRLAIVLPTLFVITVAFHILGVVPYLWILPSVVAMGVIRRHTPRIHDDFARTSSGDSGLQRYHDLIERVASERFDDPLLAELRESLSGRGDPPAKALENLFRLVELSNLRYNGQVHYPLNVMTLWDIHILSALERWKEQYGTELRGWMAALGRTDALSALAGLSHAHPDWAFPEIKSGQADGPLRLEATGLGHPLLAPEGAVRNDVDLGPPGTLLLVTGSNMSGKSTLLRAIGANVILAGAGGPVCAESMALPIADLHTSMRIRDSLEEGISYFMAELRRLKAVCEAASEADERPVLYLLDEILQGTNTAERQIAARRILRHLLDQHAIGAVTTHDLTLADAEHLQDHAVLVHFRESLELREDGPPIAFDYQLRQGIATSTNALRLMEIMGLALPEEGAED